VSRLYGRNADEIMTAMTGFRDGSLPATVMNRIAKGFSDDECARLRRGSRHRK
jgi:cytochrome c553